MITTELPSIRELEVLRATIFTGSATAAAERLGISQPSISRTLAKIEERLNLILFIRQGGRLAPTAEALALNDQLDPIFDGLDRVRSFIQSAEAIRGGRVRVLAPPSFCNHFVTPMMMEFKHAHPTVLVELRVVSSREALGAINAGEGDIAITTNRVAHPGVRMETIISTQSVCVMPPDHPLAKKDVIHATDLEGEAFIALSSNLKARMGVDRIFDRAGVTRNIVAETTTNFCACEFVASGIGITVINPFPVMRNFGDELVTRPFLPKFEHSVFAMFSAEAAPNWLGRAFLAYLKRSAATWDLAQMA